MKMHLLAITFILGAAAGVLVPSPPGPYSVAFKSFELEDPSRIDPFAPKANTTRRFMASAYLPIDAKYDCKRQVVPYMPPKTADVYGKQAKDLGLPQDIITKFEMEFCDISSLDLKKTESEMKPDFPVAVFSPGYGGSRYAYGALARAAASLGYIVITVDHTYEADIVEFPDGSVAYAQPSAASDPKLTPRELRVRVGDVSFVISQLCNTTITDSVFSKFPGTFNPRRVAAYGHSFGGSTALQTALENPHVVGGINIDGPIYGSVGKKGFSGKPFVFVSNGGDPVANFTEIYPRINALKMELEVRDTQHYSFTDVPLLLTVYKVPAASQPGIVKTFGALNGRKVANAVSQITSGAMSLLFNDNLNTLRNIGRNPDIEVVHNDLGRCD